MGEIKWTTAFAIVGLFIGIGAVKVCTAWAQVEAARTPLQQAIDAAV